jgi:hypothetical protein
MVTQDAADDVETDKDGKRTAARTTFKHTKHSLMSASHGIESELSTEKIHGYSALHVQRYHPLEPSEPSE